MESAIPKHLTSKRTQSKSVNDDYQPPYPATVVRYSADIKNVVMAYFGVQYPKSLEESVRLDIIKNVSNRLSSDLGAEHWDIATYEDEMESVNLIFIAYWTDPEVYQKWSRSHAFDWLDNPFDNPSIGTFIEELIPSVHRFETLYSSASSEGVGSLSDKRSDEIQEHAYWGAMRDRIPLSQTDPLTSDGSLMTIKIGEISTVIPQQNLCLIRSGQDWSSTDSEQRAMYLNDVEPVLQKGMDFLQHEGQTIDCYANRFMRVLDRNGNITDKSFGMSWWKNVAALEKWSKSHPTHVAIFGAAMKYLNKYTSQAQLKLYHEVTVADKTEQRFEYYNCHSKTGLLNRS